MQILLKFYVERNSGSDKRVLFWSCVLDAEINENEVDFDYLNRKNIYPIEKMDDFELCIEYNPVSIETIKRDYGDYEKRPAFFLATDKTWLTGSPYRHSSSNVETYYIDTTKFIQELKDQLNINSDYETNKLQIQAIEVIRKCIGIDILKNESVAGALSIYKRLSPFHVGGNFNAERGDRYINVRALDNNKKFDDAFVNIDVLDNKKILYNIFCKFEDQTENKSEFEYKLPAIETLEQFSQFRVTIINLENEKCQKIYEETFHLIRSFSLGMSVGGGYSKIVRNRFLTKPLDKVPLNDHLTNISRKRHKDFFDYENDYHMQLHGMGKEYLDSKYFSNDRKGCELFLEFIRTVFSTAKTVTVIDAYFDNAALNDILACSTNRFDLTIITTDPNNPDRKRKNSENLLENIYSAFPDGRVFFTEKIHDRYVYLNDDKNEKLYSLSNSWNGLVNHYNLYVQEVPYEISLQIYEEIQKYTIACNLQDKPEKTKKRQRQTANKRTKYAKAYIDRIAQAIQTMPQDVNADTFIETACEYYMAQNIDKKTINSVIRALIQRFEQSSIDGMIKIICRKMLEKQKKAFEEESQFIDGKPFAWYDTPQKCYRRLSDGLFHGGTRSYSYRIDYGLSELLNLFFKEYPSKVIELLQEQENIICKNPAFINEEDGSNIYHVSEYIIFSFLYEFFPGDVILTDDTKRFMNKCRKYTYIKMFFANILADKILDIDRKRQSFEALIDDLTFIGLNSEEFAIIFGGIYNHVSLQREESELRENIKNEIVTYILNNVSGNSISIFAYYAYICSYDIKFGPFNKFCQDLRSCHKNDEAEILQKLLLLDSVRTNTSLQTKISKMIGVDISLLNNIFQNGDEEFLKREITESDIRKYIPLVPYLSGILAECVNIDRENGFDNITNALNIDKNLIFNIKYSSEITLFYYDFYLLLSTIMDIANDNIGKIKLLELARWYLPVCLKNMPNDFYGLAIKIVGIYLIVIDDDQRKALLNGIDDLPIRTLIQCSIRRQAFEYLSVYNQFIKNADVDGYNKTIVIENLLTIGLILCMRCLEGGNNELKNELLGVIVAIDEKTNPVLAGIVKQILAYGMKYVKEPTDKNKQAFIDAMKYKFYPPQVFYLLEGEND
jgi:hypothetical protein